MFEANHTAYLQAGAQCLLEGKAQVKAFTLDSRQADTNTAFIAFKGEKADGNDYVLQAIAQGAPLVVMSREATAQELESAKDSSTALYFTHEPELYLQELAKLYRASLKALVIGITGSVGKTSTKELCRAVCQTSYNIHATEDNFNNALGVPLTILSTPEDCEVLIVEMGMSARHEIDQLCSIARPHVGIISNVGQAHIGMLGSQDEVARAKAELIENLKPSLALERFGFSQSFAILNANNAFSKWIARAVAPKVQVKVHLTANLDSISETVKVPNSKLASYFEPYDYKEFELCAKDIKLNEYAQTSFSLLDAARKTIAQAQLKLPGVHNVSNALLALELGRLLGLKLDKALSAIASLDAKGGRQHMIETSSGLRIIDDAYNASPNSVRAALKTLSQMQTQGRKFAVLGDMKELGPKEREYHYNLGLVLVESHIDKLVCVGELSKEIARGALDSGMNKDQITLTQDAQEALEFLQANVKAGDVCLIKASHSCGLDLIVKGLA